MAVMDIVRVIAVPAATLATAIAGATWVGGWGPYGAFRPMPPQCAQEQVCVIVAGLDGDVRYIPAGGDVAPIDLDDDATTRVVRWVLDARERGQDISVYKYPREIAQPELGVAGAEAQEAQALAAAREVGARYGAKLVIVGAVTGQNSFSLSFVDPARSAGALANLEYAVPDIGAPEHFADEFQAALSAALEGRPAPAPARGAPGEEKPKAVQEALAEGEEGFDVAAADLLGEGVAAPMVQPAGRPSEPTAAQLRRYYPRQARQRGVRGDAELSCRVTAEGKLADCAVVSETPTGWRFGEAAKKLAEERGRAIPQTVDGAPVGEGQVAVRYEFDPSL